MSITPGSRIGPYEVTSPLGEGGMGVVYRARDTQLQRQVALKLLPDHFANDADRLNRFEREAQVLASLNHPNIAQIYGLEKTGSGSCIVMELVEGETLAERLTRGPIPLDEAVQMAKQIVDALEAAHERGIVHRDLKPGNIKQTPQGAVKILDFGLAKAALSSPSSAASFANSPTLPTCSMAGVILGTAPYMSPEQARAKLVDARTDIWAFGCVLYEMLTGKQTFAGETTTDILAKVLEGQPKWDALPETPPSIRLLLETALKKDPKRRLQYIGDARVFLDRPETLDTSTPLIIRDRGGRRGWFAAAVMTALFAATLVPAGLYFTRTPPALPVMRFEMPAPGFVTPGTPMISPDGQRIAYVATNSGKTAIWVRPIGSLTAQELPGTDNAFATEFWAPDSRHIAFVADGKLKKVDISGGVQTLADAPVFATPGTWNRDGTILMGGFVATPGIMRISESGGAWTPVTGVDAVKYPIQIAPEFLPDGRHFLFHTLSIDTQTGSVYFASVDSKTTTRVMEIPNMSPTGNSGVTYSQGYLLFSRDRTLLAQPFDATKGTVSGDPVPVAENVGFGSLSETGVLVYRAIPSQSAQPAAHISTLDRKGNPLREVSTPSAVGSFSFRDGQLVIDNNSAPGLSANTDVWVIDARGVPTKLTAENPNLDVTPVWSPDGSRVAFASNREKTGLSSRLYTKASNGVGTAELLLSNDGTTEIDFPNDWSTAGILFERLTLRNLQAADLWFLAMPDKKPSVYLHNGFLNTQAQVSPDGKYVAYVTNESGSFQIVVQTFPDSTSDKKTITAKGGAEPLWKRDGSELYYLAADGKIMVVPFKANPTVQAGQPSELFQTTLPPDPTPFKRRYAVSADGQQFLVAAPSVPAAPGNPIPITAVINWSAAMKKK
jgi:dipeptidyl aminopeptidase/acylaminoacyl peptidase